MQKRMLFLIVAAALLASCGGDYKKSKSGLIYKIYSDGKGPTAKKDQIIKMHMVQKYKDSVLGETYTTVPNYSRVDSLGPVYHFAELFPMLRKGDSMVVVLLGDSIQKKFGLPQFMKKEDKIMLHFKVLDIFPDVQTATADRTAEFSKQKSKQEQAFAKYVAGKQNLQKTAKGNYVAVQSPGDGPAVENGKMVSIRYTGKLIPSEKVFESNVYDFVVGQGQAIAGWDDALLLFKKGGKGVLYIPADQAYGDQQGPGGMPFQPLMFDIEVVDVRDAPKDGPPMMMPPNAVPDTTRRR
jgi:FKBP-type peptidyl-prolyl cis-trans isomerase FkpA